MSNYSSITGSTKILCVIGHPIGHSMSPTMHNAVIDDLKLDYIYIAFDVHPDLLEKAVDGFKALGIKGINVTIPHKINVMQYLDEIDPLAIKIGAVNTIKNEDGRLIGKNTDALGAKRALINVGCRLRSKKILILGAGGAARAIAFSLAEEAKEIVILNRTVKKAQNLAQNIIEHSKVIIKGKHLNQQNIKEELKDSNILINTTSVGMKPQEDPVLVPKEVLHSDLFVFDVIYNPLETRLLEDAKKMGCKILGGLDMLVNQGASAFEWWTGKKPNRLLMKNRIIEFLGLK